MWRISLVGGYFVAALVALAVLGCSPEAPAETAAAEAPSSVVDRVGISAAVEAVLLRQQDAWNQGDIDTFMNDYVRGDRLRFASGGNVRRGWQETLERYRRTYPNDAAMGQLTFSELEVTVLSDDYAEVHGRWQLARESDAPGGRFTLLFERQDAVGGAEGDWQILHDHTSSDTE